MPTAPGFADCSLRFNLAGYNRPAYVTFGVNPTATDPAVIASDLVNAWTATGSMNSKLDNNVTMTEAMVRLGTDGSEDLVGSAINTTVGGLSASSPPPNVAVLVYKRTARGGRRGRGRMYFPWFTSTGDLTDDGTIGPTKVTALAVSIGVWKTELSTRGCPLVLLHSPGKTSMGAPDPVTSLVVSNVVATQRRRLVRA